MLDPIEINWFHSIDVGNGVVTNGLKSASALRAQFNGLGLTADSLRGKRVLDIGTCDGYMALECARLGAEVIAVDGIYRDALRYVMQHAEHKFQFYAIDFLSPSMLELGRFDIVLYLGVLYHTVYPWEHLQRLALICNTGAKVFIQTNFYNLPGNEQAATVYYDYSQRVTHDKTSPVFPSLPWLYGSLKRLGFDEIKELAIHPMGVPSAGAPNPDGRHIGSVELAARYSGKPEPFLYAVEQE